MDTVASIEAVLLYAKTSSTYKFAVLRALVDVTIEAPGREPRNGFHNIPIVDIARRTIAYYWRPSLLRIPQLGRIKPTGHGYPKQSIPGYICSLSDSDIVIPGIELKDEKAGGLLADWILEANDLPPEVVNTVLDVRDKIIEMPLEHLPYLQGRTTDFFSVFTHAKAGQIQLSPFTDHKEHLKAAPKKNEMRASAWNDLLDNERTDVVLSARAYEEITEYRYWLQDAIILRWARECESISGDSTYTVPLSAFDIVPGAERDQNRVKVLKSLYRSAGVNQCLYTGVNLSSGFDIDHFLPFSRFPVNLFWNMVPSSKEANRGKGGKSDRIPQLTEDLQSSYRNFLTRVIATDDPLVNYDLEATYRRYYQDIPPRGCTVDKRVKEVLSVVTKSWKRLEKAGIGVWEMND